MKGIVKPEDLLEVKEGGWGRWYNIKDVGEVPSVTTVLQYGFPTSPFLLKWFKENTKEHCEGRRDEAANRGTRIHDTCQRLIETGTFNTKILNPLEKIDVKGLINWKKDYKPKFEETECVIVFDEAGVKTAGRVDLVCTIKGQKWLVDFKTSSRLHRSNEPQVALYASAVGAERAALLHLNDTKKGYTFKEINILEGFQAFIAAYTLFQYLGYINQKGDGDAKEKK